jgi:hypothetical protein
VTRERGAPGGRNAKTKPVLKTMKISVPCMQVREGRRLRREGFAGGHSPNPATPARAHATPSGASDVGPTWHVALKDFAG